MNNKLLFVIPLMVVLSLSLVSAGWFDSIKPSSSITGNAALWSWSFCTSSHPCDAGQGDCDYDKDCKAGLTCEQNVGANYGRGWTLDVCEEVELIKNIGGGDDIAPTGGPSSVGGSTNVWTCAKTGTNTVVTSPQGQPNNFPDYCVDDNTVSRTTCKYANSNQATSAGVTITNKEQMVLKDVRSDCTNGCNVATATCNSPSGTPAPPAPTDTTAGCVDSDDKDYKVKGTTTFSGLSVEDTCLSDTALLEFYCNYPTIKRVIYSYRDCKLSFGANYQCSDGACKIA